ncbi:MAG: hypothetical protein CVV27_17385, partial [Candidatus Melainabacteria bacterium HGW-Melainabacteria-1]
MTAGWNFLPSSLKRALGVGLWAILALAWIGPVAAPAAPQAKVLHIVLLTPRNDAFWTLFARIGQAAAEDLGIRLEWLPAMNDAKKHLADALAVLARPDKPDAIILKNFDGTARPILAAAEKAGVYSMLFEEGFAGTDLEAMGRPREKYRYWLGEFLPDNFEAGYSLTQAIIAKAKDRFAQRPLQMVAIAGNMNEGSSADRVQG